VLAKLKEFQTRFGDDFKPAALLEKLAAEGGTFSKA
jgi:3-hydroxyacyl-CoA dehydrogenase